MLLLDTHVWIWSVERDVRRVGRRARQLISRAEAEEAVRISPASIFEVTALHVSGRLHLANPPEHWIRRALDAAGGRIAELSPVVAIDAGHLPRVLLPDPLDRILVATARQLDAVFLTADRRILDYASDTGFVRARDASV